VYAGSSIFLGVDYKQQRVIFNIKKGREDLFGPAAKMLHGASNENVEFYGPRLEKLIGKKESSGFQSPDDSPTEKKGSSI